MAGRFFDSNLESILVHAAGALVVRNTPPEGHSLALGTSSWSNSHDEHGGCPIRTGFPSRPVQRTLHRPTVG
jgi:hypothetical protein